jgi:hypothetical protein
MASGSGRSKAGLEEGRPTIDRRAGDPFVTIFVGDDRADVHASCHPKWFARQETEARAALDPRHDNYPE